MHVIHRIHPELIRFTDSIAIQWYGLSYLAGFLLGYLLLKQFIQKGFFQFTVPQLQDCLSSFCIFGVLLGGRLGYFLFYDFGSLMSDPLQIVKVWEGGMASHGGLLGGTAVLFWYARKTKVPFLHLTDQFATVAPLGIGLGRLANFINGELWGRPSTVPWAIVFPLERSEFEKGGPLEAYRYNLEFLQSWVERGWLVPRHPSQLYQAFAEGFLLFAVLLFLRFRPWSRNRNGRLSILFVLGYAAARFTVEFWREPDEGLTLFFGWMSRGQFLTLFMFAIGLSLLGWLERPKHT